MARISRKCYESGFFHLMVQGIKKEKIFNNRMLKEKYIEFIKNSCKKYDVKLVAFCTMDNHCHILLYTEKIERLSKVMASSNTKFGILYNKINKRCGYVFRDRYRCENIYTQTYLENCIRYIHNNPVKAGICINKRDYKYSSYNSYINNEVPEEIIKLVYKNKKYRQILDYSIIEGKFIDIEDEFGNKITPESSEKVLEEFKNLDLKNKENMAIVISNLLKRCNINKTEIAKLLGIDHRSISRFLRFLK